MFNVCSAVSRWKAVLRARQLELPDQDRADRLELAAEVSELRCRLESRPEPAQPE
jgi:hypothetical protein